jgi:hypothetical protein
MAIVLTYDIDGYEPSEQEVKEYAEWLGMDMEDDASLVWIARDGLKAQVPKPWRPCQSTDGDIFYFNFQTGESSWDHPCDEHYRAMYLRAKAERDTPTRVVTVRGSCAVGGMPIVRCVGSLAGDELAVLRFKPRVTVNGLRCALARRLKIKSWSLRLVLEDGTMLAKEDDGALLISKLGLDEAVTRQFARPAKKDAMTDRSSQESDSESSDSVKEDFDSLCEERKALRMLGRRQSPAYSKQLPDTSLQLDSATDFKAHVGLLWKASPFRRLKYGKSKIDTDESTTIGLDLP